MRLFSCQRSVTHSRITSSSIGDSGSASPRAHARPAPRPALRRRAGAIAIFVHGYLTVDGQKLSKSLGGTQDHVEIASRYRSDVLRWRFLRVPRSGDADFRAELRRPR